MLSDCYRLFKAPTASVPIDPSKTGRGGIRDVWASTLQEAEDILDWLEANGCDCLELAHRPGTGFAIRYRRRRARRKHEDHRPGENRS
jgi:hypothetical protein